ncbi:MAG: type II toxin-antitoxin system YoeB family toxin, partial [Clostridiales bacterium]|nr:type II toxin-antitoxin system YoeB family toxin [Clostridiales bacterium]
MIIEYETSGIIKYFEDFSLMQKKIGADLTRAVKNRCNQLMAAKSYGIYLSTGLGKPHRLYYNLNGYYGVNLTGNVRLIIRPESESLKPKVLNECDTVHIKG